MEVSYEQALEACKDELEDIKNLSNVLKDQYSLYLIRYAVIKSSGTIERVFKDILADKVSEGASKEVTSYFDKTIRRNPCNPSYSKITELLVNFGGKANICGTWANTFTSKVQAKESPQTPNIDWLNSLVTLRNTFSHGGPITASIGDVQKYFQSGWTILECLDATLNPPPSPPSAPASVTSP